MLYRNALNHPSREYLDILVEADIYPCEKTANGFANWAGHGDDWDTAKYAQLFLINNISESAIIMKTQGEWRPRKAKEYPKSTRMALRTLLLLAKT